MQRLPAWGMFYGLLLCTAAYAQTGLRLRGSHGGSATVRVGTQGHHVLQFQEAPTSQQVMALEGRGIRVLGDVPGNGLLISAGSDVELDPVELADFGVSFADRVVAADKLSPVSSEFLLVELFADADRDRARATLIGLNLELRENPDLLPNHLMIRRPQGILRDRVLRRIAGLEEVAYIFPASEELIRGSFVVACSGALTMNGSAGQLIANYGEGWDGPGKNATTLNYVLSSLTQKLPSATARGEILRAMEEWSKVIQLTWNPATNSNGTRTVNLLFAAGAHGDSYPFDGPGKVLAHTFYPAPPNPEPVAGDLHLDDDELWRVGANIDLFSVVLHELGHALGLGHSDNPNDVMYPYYRITSTLAPGDKAAILSLYAAAGSTSTPTPRPSVPAPSNPLTLTVTPPAPTTSATTLTLAGTVGGSLAPTVTWTSSAGTFGVARVTGSTWTIASIPLIPGMNSIAVTAASGLAHVDQTVTITRQAGQAAVDTTAPQLTILSPAGTTVSTSLASITVSGTSTDNVGVSRVTWQVNTGGSGTATGTTNWSATVPLVTGRNTIVIQTYDAAGNSSWRSLVVTK